MFNSLLAIMVSPLLLQVQSGVTSCRTSEFAQPQIKVNVVELPVSLVQELSVDEMQIKYRTKLYERQKKMKKNYFLHDTDYEMMQRQLSGVTRADLTFNTDISFASMPMDTAGNFHCLLFKEIIIDVSFQTVMSIARDLKEGECVFEAVKDYQMKYHNANSEVVMAVTEEMRAKLPSMLIQYEHGFVPKHSINDTYEEMKKVVETSVQQYREDMDMLMQEYRSYIDTPEELKKLADSCKVVENTGVPEADIEPSSADVGDKMIRTEEILTE